MKIDTLQLNKLAQSYKTDSVSEGKSKESFKDLLSNSLHKVNNLQKDADLMAEKLAVGEADNIHEVMIASTKAKLSLDLTLEVRNKVVEAYKDIMRMQI
ncbi:flagellar hook-basal body complex protein FliE [Selenihalanaerobacter shriftii]|uniref:Flagellar hook-basal body complex protein FliE n=1 Tax=Selenihalanaerobacter shriftii TaxID=142842 RepID=A0A1T4MAZ9_9FIRM|nr:flagellar hook-basal body complex protein FliE [Selenihalanaerobacter shriftii]SJZ64026.1 flagellar hook-basal body complex protein FliE [Selenihalanaerobacter shriftii]